VGQADLVEQFFDAFEAPRLGQAINLAVESDDLPAPQVIVAVGVFG
jgi:hypothetical protein